MLGTLIVWIISYLGCADKQSGFWGDVYRYIGFSSMALTLIACWIISKYFKFEKWLLWLFMAVSCVVFGWQILNMYGIDPLNWQMDLLGYNKWILNDEKLYYAWILEAITGVLFKPKTMILMAVLVIVYGAIIILCNKKMDKIGKIVKNVYIGAIAVVVAAVGAVVVYANTTEIYPTSGSFLLNLKLQESFGGYRGTIWRVTMSMFGDSNVFQKLFGIGMDNFSTQAYVN